MLVSNPRDHFSSHPLHTSIIILQKEPSIRRPRESHSSVRGGCQGRRELPHTPKLSTLEKVSGMYVEAMHWHLYVYSTRTRFRCGRGQQTMAQHRQPTLQATMPARFSQLRRSSPWRETLSTFATSSRHLSSEGSLFSPLPHKPRRDSKVQEIRNGKLWLPDGRFLAPSQRKDSCTHKHKTSLELQSRTRRVFGGMQNHLGLSAWRVEPVVI